MTDRDHRLLSDTTKLSPTIAAALSIVEKMKPVPICVACTAARWYKLENAKGDETLECFCVQFRSVVCGRGKDAIIACDAQIDIGNDK